MNQLPTHDFKSFIEHLVACYPEHYDNMTKERLGLWQRAVQPYDLDTLKESVISHGVQSQFPPVPVDITTKARRIKAARFDKSAAEDRRQEVRKLEQQCDDEREQVEATLKDLTSVELADLRAKVLSAYGPKSPLNRLSVKSYIMRIFMAKAVVSPT